MSDVISVRFPSRVAARLRALSKDLGEPVSAMAARLVEEGLRLEGHPGIIFRPGPTGRRAALLRGPDVWEVIDVLRSIDARGDEAVAQTARWLNLTEAEVRVAVRYCAEFPDEIDERIEANYLATEHARAAWEAEQRLLA
ncbi:MAG: hypothetical protein ACRD0K_18410 [Egibacteraceae bacterium]